MLILDPIADYLTRIRNAQMAGHAIVEIPSSKVKKAITKILYDQGFIAKYKFDEESGPFETIKIALKYDPSTRQPVIRELGRISRPGLRKYVKAADLPRIINGLGIAIVSTSKGILTDKDAREQKLGGELMCYVY
ncbi:MAG: 30S ribosomal protein S8 [Saprospiraceae bacterium]|nr:30S ribosomal protein S8 [Saprospiraceae bacterium]